METGAFFVVAGIATILVIHAIQDGDDARRYARFLLTGQGPGGTRIDGSTGPLKSPDLGGAIGKFAQPLLQSTPARPNASPTDPRTSA